MRRLGRSAITLLVLVGLVAWSGIAWAESHEEDEVTDVEVGDVADTLFSFGYDLINRILLWDLSDLDGLYDCTLENGPLTATYGVGSPDGVIPVDNLEDEAGPVSFTNRPPEEVADDLEPADSPIAYSGADGECGVSGGEVSGPNGQVNHGMFMKLFNSLYEGQGRGCVARHLAQSDLGKGDQQVKPGEDTEFESVVAGATGTVEFTSVEADCEHGKKEDQALDGEQQGGKPDHAGKPDDAGTSDHSGKPESPGNSGSAPGQNK